MAGGLLRSARALAAVALLALLGALALPAPAQAQTVTTLVSNTGETPGSSSSSIQAQTFTTGSNTGGYTLSEVDVRHISSISTSGTMVKVMSDNGSGRPGALVANLDNPSSFPDDSIIGFTAPASTETLAANTVYWVVVNDGRAFGVSTRTNIGRTNSSDETATAADPNWSIGDTRYWRNRPADNWSASSAPLVFAIKGTAVGGGTPSSDATLSALTVTAGGSDLVTFASGTTDYTPMVANDVEEVTVTAMTTDSGATIEYLDASDMTLEDADTGVTDLQVAVAVGDTVIKVKVTAEDGNATQTYKVTVTRAAAMTGGICDRTVKIQEVILAEISGVDNCAAVTDANLASITTFGAFGLSTSNQGITSLQKGDFAGLTSLTLLNLSQNSLPSLPEGIFAGLGELTELNLTANQLESLPEGAFSDLTALTILYLSSNNLSSLDAGRFSGMTALEDLFLNGNALESLPEELFSGLTALDNLYLNGNALESLPEGLFSGLTELDQLDLNDNALNALPEGLFSDLTALTFLDLEDNALESLPGTVFSGLTALTSLDLKDNALNALPKGLFSDLTALIQLNLSNNSLNALPDELFLGLTALDQLDLSSNSTNPMELTVTVEKVGTNQVRAKVLAGAPFAVDIPVTPVNGTFEGSVTVLGVAAGAVEGTAVTMTRTVGTTTAATVDVDLTTQPTLASGHVGYIFKKATNLPATILPAVGASTDATLSDLVVNDGTTDLTLTPTFASSKYTYRASVTNTVTEVTVTPTKNDSGATIEYLAASSIVTLEDADTGVTGQQVAVAVGDTIIQVKVTAADGVTTQTYTVTVNRAAAMPPICTLNTGDLWCGVVAVGQTQIPGVGVSGYGFSGTTIGDLSDNDRDKTFAIGANSYTIDRVTVGAADAGVAGLLTFSLTSALTATDKEQLVLHVGSASFAFSGRTPSVVYDYVWSSTLDWSSESTVTLRLREAPAGPDATLSALVVNDGRRDLTLRPGFAPGMYTYRASVVNAVAEVTVTAMTTDADARIDWLDASDMTLEDADTGVTGQQVTLAEGDNVVKVKVTAKDGNTTRTYTVTVTRRAVDAPGVEGDLRLTAEEPYTHPDGHEGVSGRVEIFHAGRWGTVCSDGFSRAKTSRFIEDLDTNGDPLGTYTYGDVDNNAPALVCKSMGYDTGEYASGYGQPGESQPSGPQMTYYPVGSTYSPDDPLPIWVDDMTCAAGDADLREAVALPAPLAHCGYAGWGLHNCTHNEDAGVRCWNVPESDMAGARSLKARFVSPPEQHDGSGRVKVRVAFSEAIEESPENVGEHGVKVEGGRVTSVRRVDNRPGGGAAGRSAGRSGDGQEDGERVWEFEIEPGSAEDLTMRIDGGRPCDEPGAICTEDGRSLSEGIATTVVGPGPAPLTGGVRGHTGGARRGGCVPLPGGVQRGDRDRLPVDARRLVHGGRGRGDQGSPGGPAPRPVADHGRARRRGRCDGHAAGRARVRGLRGDLHPGRGPQAVDQHGDGDGGRPGGRGGGRGADGEFRAGAGGA